MSASSFIMFSGGNVEFSKFQDISNMLRLTLGLVRTLLLLVRAVSLVVKVLIGTHVWSKYLTFKSLGRSGWFYGDFFKNPTQDHPKYTGIYRYLDDPETTLGQAAYWGLAVLSGEGGVYLLAGLYHTCALLLLRVIEKPHRQRIYVNARSNSRVSGLFDQAISLVIPGSAFHWLLSRISASHTPNPSCCKKKS